jgi:hypothetical protein
MVKVCILQTDNRPSLNYLLKTQEVNKKFCNILGYEYLFIKLKNEINPDMHPATQKIFVLNDVLQHSKYDILVFLDSDAWIQNGYWLHNIINNLINSEQKQGCFSRDPFIKINTFINSGSFIIKNNDFTKQMFKYIIDDLNNNDTYHNSWPFDQHYISNYIFEHKDQFVIFVPDILNTPIGKVLRHNWRKNKKMYYDLNKLTSDINNFCFDKDFFIEKDYYDDKDFPNLLENGYEYDN